MESECLTHSKFTFLHLFFEIVEKFILFVCNEVSIIWFHQKINRKCFCTKKEKFTCRKNAVETKLDTASQSCRLQIVAIQFISMKLRSHIDFLIWTENKNDRTISKHMYSFSNLKMFYQELN